MKNGTSGNGVGGGERAGGMQPRISTYTPMSTNHGDTDSLVQRSHDFQELAKAIVAASAREALERNPSLTPKQKAQLRDAERGRYGVQVIALLLECMTSAVNPTFFADRVRGATLQSVAASIAPTICLTDALLNETRKQAVADVSQQQFHVERTTARRDQALDAVGPHIVALELYRDTALAFNPTGRRTFS